MQSLPYRMLIAHISTFPPLRCGIASFVSDLILATPWFDHLQYRLHYGGEPQTQDLEGANVNCPTELAQLGRSVSASDCDVVSLQHEFGIWGGREGENIHAFLDNLHKPLVSVLHTTFGPRNRSRVQADIVRRLVNQSVRVIVLTKASKVAVESLCDASVPKIAVIPHGVPDRPYAEPPEWPSARRRKATSPLRFITPGFLRPDKGLEQALYALGELRDRGYDVSYLIAGEPQRQFPDQESYCTQVEGLIASLDLERTVKIDKRYLSLEEQIGSIQRCHLGLFPYQISSWASSGTVPLVMCTGRPVLCTPFEYASAKAEEGPGVFLSTGFDSAAIAVQIERLLALDNYSLLCDAVYQGTRNWTWTRIGTTIRDVYLSFRDVPSG